MKIQINGQDKEVSAATVAELVEQLGLKGDRVAIELNRDIVSRAKWAETLLHEGDKLEMVHFVGGGCFTTRPPQRRHGDAELSEAESIPVFLFSGPNFF